MVRKKLSEKIPSLKEFMVRREVLQLYRDVFRATRKVPDEKSKAYLRKWARDDIERYRNVDDKHKIRHLLFEGRKALDELIVSMRLVK
eukprot:Nk52_evm7s319 gene=Nk52_evmTU7s319